MSLFLDYTANKTFQIFPKINYVLVQDQDIDLKFQIISVTYKTKNFRQNTGIIPVIPVLYL